MRKSKNFIPVLLSIIGFFIPILIDDSSWVDLVKKSYEFFNLMMLGYSDKTTLILVAIPIIAFSTSLLLSFFFFLKNDFKNASLCLSISAITISYLHVYLILLKPKSWGDFIFWNPFLGFWYYIYPCVIWWAWLMVTLEKKQGKFNFYVNFETLKVIVKVTFRLFIFIAVLFGTYSYYVNGIHYKDIVELNSECDICPPNVKISLRSIKGGLNSDMFLFQIKNFNSVPYKFIFYDDDRSLKIIKLQLFTKKEKIEKLNILNRKDLGNNVIVPPFEKRAIKIEVKDHRLLKGDSFSIISVDAEEGKVLFRIKDIKLTQ